MRMENGKKTAMVFVICDVKHWFERKIKYNIHEIGVTGVFQL